MAAEYSIKQMESYLTFPTILRASTGAQFFGHSSRCLHEGWDSTRRPIARWLCVFWCLLVDPEFHEHISFIFYIHSDWHIADPQKYLLNLIWSDSHRWGRQTELVTEHLPSAGWFPHYRVSLPITIPGPVTPVSLQRRQSFWLSDLAKVTQHVRAPRTPWEKSFSWRGGSFTLSGR